MQKFLMIADIWQKDLDKIKKGIKSVSKEKNVKIVQNTLKKYLEKILHTYPL